MATLLTLVRYNGSHYGSSREAIGSCIENPPEVLKILKDSFQVYNYKGVFAPVDSAYPHNCAGIEIEQTETGADSIHDYVGDLPQIGYERTSSTFFVAARDAIERQLSWNHYGTNKTLLDPSAPKMNDAQQKIFDALAEIIEVTLERDCRSVARMRGMLRGDVTFLNIRLL